MHRMLLVFIVLLPSLVVAQTEAIEDNWAALKFLEGKWVDEKPGVSKVKQEYDFILEGKYLQVRTKAVFEPNERNPEGEVHEDLGIFSYDQFRKTFVFRQFHSEGFVNQYILDKKDSEMNELTFISEQIENAPEGTRAKVIFKFISEDEIEQSFHVAWPGKEYACFALNKLKRTK